MSRKSRTVWLVLRCGVGLGLLSYVLAATGVELIGPRLRSIGWLWAGLVALTCLGTVIEARRLGLLFASQRMRLPFGIAVRLVAIGTFFNLAVPGGTGGDLVKLYYLASRNRGRGLESGTVLFVDRAVALFALLALVIGLAVLEGRAVTEHRAVTWLVWLVVAGMLGLSLAAVGACSARVRTSRIYTRLMREGLLGSYLQRMADALYAFRDHKRELAGAALLSLIGHVALGAMFWTVGTALFPEAPALATVLLALLGMLANALPLSPGGLGVGEAAFEGLFRLIGVVGGAHLIMAWRVGTLPLSAVGCFLYVLGDRGRFHVPAVQETGGRVPGLGHAEDVVP